MGFGLLVEPVFSLVREPGAGLFGDLLEDAWGIAAIALLLSFRPAGGSRKSRAGAGRRRGRAVTVAGVPPASLPRARRELPARARGTRDRGPVPGCLRAAHGVRVPWHRGRDRRPLQAGLATASPRDAAERGGHLVLCLLRVRESSAWAPPRWLAPSLAAGAGGVPRRPAAVAARARRRRPAVRRDPDAPAPSCRRGLREAGRGPEPRGRTPDAHVDPTAPPCARPAPGARGVELDGAALVYDAALDEDRGWSKPSRPAAAVALDHQRLEADRRPRGSG